MSLDIAEFGALLDELSLGLVMVDPEDLISLGEVLSKVETLMKACESIGPPEGTLILKGVNKALEAIVLDKVSDKVQVMEVVGQGVGLLQELWRSFSAGNPWSGDMAGFMAGLRDHAKVELDAGAAPKASVEAPPQESAAPAEPPMAEEAMMYDASQDQDLFFGFIAESTEHIESIEVNIIELEQNPDDLDVINSVFRPFHTIKGVSGFLNLQEIHSLTHDVENLLDDARNARLQMTPAVIDLVLDAVDLLKRMIADVKVRLETGETVTVDYGIPAFVERIKAIQQGDEGEAAAVEPAAAESKYVGMRLGEILVDQGMVDQEELEQLLQDQEDKRLRKLGEILVEQGVISGADLEDALRLQAEHEDKKLGEILVDSGKVGSDDLEQAMSDQEQMRSEKLGEMLIREKVAEPRAVAGALREQKKAAGEPATMGQTVKVDTIKLDGLVDMVGELVIAQSLVASNDKIRNLKDQKIIRDLSHLARITSELQRTAMSLRMVPIRQTFQKMIRLVRDLARKSGKQVDLTMSGEDTEIDRNMVEAIYDPLVHMVRNSVDHGVEMPDVRDQVGKPREGRVHLRAFHQGGNVVIEISDDGKGLDKEKILAKGIERGLVSPDDTLSEHAIFNLIFQPGFSTAEKITDVSGRGVGMDVVKKAIEKMRGKIEVNSKLGQGSTITIRLPLTLAIIDGMIVRVGDNRYILPTVAIHESFRPGKGDYHTVKGQGEMIKVRENLLPLVRLDDILGAVGSVTDPSEALVVVVENEGERRCILVDEVLGKQEVVIKSLGERLKYVRSLAGGSILGDGRVGLILDVAGVFEVSDGMMGGRIRSTGGNGAAKDWDMEDDWGMGPT